MSANKENETGQNMEEAYISPFLREKVKALKELKESFDISKDVPFSATEEIKRLGLPSGFLRVMKDIGYVKMERIQGTRSNWYEWTGPEITAEVARTIYEEHSRKAKEQNQRYFKRKKEREQKEKEEEMRLKQMEKEKRKQQRIISNGGSLLDKNNTELINDLKARSEGITPEMVDVMSSELKPRENKEEAVKTEDNTPITIEVTTEGNKKTITIKLEI